LKVSIQNSGFVFQFSSFIKSKADCSGRLHEGNFFSIFRRLKDGHDARAGLILVRYSVLLWLKHLFSRALCLPWSLYASLFVF